MRLLTIVWLLYAAAAQAAVDFVPARGAQPLPAPESRLARTLAHEADGELFTRLKLKSTAPVSDYSHIREQLGLCERCHAQAIHANNTYLPILQGQNLEYLFAKIVFFRDNADSFHPLRSLSQSLDDDTIIDIALYFARQSSSLDNSLLLTDSEPMNEQGVDENRLSSCTQCHGDDGNGAMMIPAISGQNENYLSYRIREIANNDSRVHLSSLAAVSCQIAQLDLASSKRVARQLAMVVDRDRVVRGETIYSRNCSRCHDHGDWGAPKLSDTWDWKQRIRQGTRELVRNTVLGKQNMPARGGNWRLSRNQLLDAIHFMLDRVGLNRN